MGVESAIGIVSGVVGIAGAVGGYAENQNASASQRDAAKYKAEVNKLRNKQSKLVAQREREQAIKEARVVRSSLVTTAAEGGQLGASSVAGAEGSLQSQLYSNIGFGTQMQAIEDQMLEYENKAIMAGSDASESSQNANVWNSAGDIVGGFEKAAENFGKFRFGGGGESRGGKP